MLVAEHKFHLELVRDGAAVEAVAIAQAAERAGVQRFVHQQDFDYSPASRPDAWPRGHVQAGKASAPSRRCRERHPRRRLSDFAVTAKFGEQLA